MKIRQITLFVTCFFILNNLAKAQSLYDDFSSNFVNTDLWQVILPFSTSQVTESGGFATTTGRGILTTVDGFNAPFTISSSVTFNSVDEHFEVNVGTDLSINNNPDGAYNELTGVSVEFAPDGTYGGLSIQMFTQTNVTILATGNYSLAVGQPYNFTITNTGSNIALAIDGLNQISAETSYTTGDQIAFSSREFSFTSSSMSYVSIQPVPEPSTVAMFGLGTLTIMFVLKQKLIESES